MSLVSCVSFKPSDIWNGEKKLTRLSVIIYHTLYRRIDQKNIQKNIWYPHAESFTPKSVNYSRHTSESLNNGWKSTNRCYRRKMSSISEFFQCLKLFWLNMHMIMSIFLPSISNSLDDWNMVSMSIVVQRHRLGLLWIEFTAIKQNEQTLFDKGKERKRRQKFLSHISFIFMSYESV